MNLSISGYRYFLSKSESSDYCKRVSTCENLLGSKGRSVHEDLPFPWVSFFLTAPIRSLIMADLVGLPVLLISSHVGRQLIMKKEIFFLKFRRVSDLQPVGLQSGFACLKPYALKCIYLQIIYGMRGESSLTENSQSFG